MAILEKKDIYKYEPIFVELHQEFEKQQKQVEKLIEVNKKLQNSFLSIKKNNDGAEAKKLVEVTEKLTTSTKKLKDAKTASVKIEEKILKAKEKLNESRRVENRELTKLRVTQIEYNRKAKEAAKISLGLTDAFQKLTKRTNDAQRKFKKLAAEFGVNSKQAKAAHLQFSKLDTELREINNAAKDGHRDIGRYGAGLSGGLKKLGGNLKNIGKQMLGGFGIIAIIGMIGTALKSANEKMQFLAKSSRRLQGTFDITAKKANKLAIQINAIANNFENVETQQLEVALTAITGSFKNLSEQEALAMIEEGFQKGSNNSGEFLDILKEYPVFFKKAGVTADEMFAIINQQIKAGVYSDKGVDAIKEATMQLTENTKAVKIALKPLGESINLQIRQKVEAGKAFEAIQLITKEMEALGYNSSEAQTIIADIFKGAGEDSENFIKNLHNIDSSLENVAKQTSVAEDANLRLSKSYNTFLLVVNEGNSIFATMKAAVIGYFADIFDNLTLFSEINWANKFKMIANAILGLLEKLFLPILNVIEKNIGKKIAFRFNIEKSKKGLAVLKTKTDDLEKSTRRLTLAEEEALKLEEKLEKFKKKKGKDAGKTTKKELDAYELLKKSLTDLKIKYRELVVENKEGTAEAINYFDEIKKIEAEIKRIDLTVKSGVIPEKERTSVAITAIDPVTLAKSTEDEINQYILTEHQKTLDLKNEKTRLAFEKKAEMEITAENARRRFVDGSISAGIQFANDLFKASQDAKFMKLQSASEAEKEILADKLQKGLINEAFYKKKVELIDKKILIAAAKAEKRNALFNIGIQTAVNAVRMSWNPAAVAWIIGLGLVQAAAVAAKPLPTYGKGKINHQGKSHSEGGIDINIEGGESTISGIGTANAPKLLKEINVGKIKDSDLMQLKNENDNNTTLLQFDNFGVFFEEQKELTRDTNNLLKKMKLSYENGNAIHIMDLDGVVINKIIKS